MYTAKKRGTFIPITWSYLYMPVWWAVLWSFQSLSFCLYTFVFIVCWGGLYTIMKALHFAWCIKRTSPLSCRFLRDDFLMTLKCKYCEKVNAVGMGGGVIICVGGNYRALARIEGQKSPSPLFRLLSSSTILEVNRKHDLFNLVYKRDWLCHEMVAIYYSLLIKSDSGAHPVLTKKILIVWNVCKSSPFALPLL